MSLRAVVSLLQSRGAGGDGWQTTRRATSPNAQSVQKTLADILSVAHGLRPALLFDTVDTTPGNILACLEGLEGEFPAVCALRVLWLAVEPAGAPAEGDGALAHVPFVFNPALLGQHLAAAFPCIVDVTGGSRAPSVVDGALAKRIEERVRALLHPCVAESAPRIVELCFSQDGTTADGCQGLFVPSATVFGCMLEYPVVYWLSRPSAHCLNFTSINHYQAVLKVRMLEREHLHPLTAFTIPVSVLRDDLQASVDTWARRHADRSLGKAFPSNFAVRELTVTTTASSAHSVVL